MKIIDRVNKAILGGSYNNRSPIEKWGGSYFYGQKLALTLWGDKTFEAFNKVPEVNAVLNYRANAKKNIKINVISKTTDEPARSPNALKIFKLLNHPNFYQDQKEFIRQSSLFHDISGNEYLYFMNSMGFKPINAKALFSLPPQLVDCKLLNNEHFFQITDNAEIKYTIQINQDVVPLISDHMVHLNDNRVNIENENILKGESKLKALRAPINNIIAAYEARNVFLTKRGALGILSNESKDGTGGSVPLDPKEKNALQEEFKKYGVQHDQFHTIITNMPLTWQQMGVDIDKLKVFEEVREDFYKILDAYGVPQDLFARDRGTTFNNQQNAERRFYESTIIPDAKEWIGALNKFFSLESESYEIVGDFSHLPIFQEDELDRAKVNTQVVNYLSRAFQDGAISLDEYQSELKANNVLS
jgi:phage portal protein BeeE